MKTTRKCGDASVCPTATCACTCMYVCRVYCISPLIWPLCVYGLLCESHSFAFAQIYPCCSHTGLSSINHQHAALQPRDAIVYEDIQTMSAYAEIKSWIPTKVHPPISISQIFAAGDGNHLVRVELFRQWPYFPCPFPTVCYRVPAMWPGNTSTLPCRAASTSPRGHQLHPRMLCIYIRSWVMG